MFLSANPVVGLATVDHGLHIDMVQTFMQDAFPDVTPNFTPGLFLFSLLLCIMFVHYSQHSPNYSVFKKNYVF